MSWLRKAITWVNLVCPVCTRPYRRRARKSPMPATCGDPVCRLRRSLLSRATSQARRNAERQQQQVQRDIAALPKEEGNLQLA